MNRQRDTRTMRKINVRLFDGDIDRLKSYYPGSYNAAIRALVHRHLNALDTKTRAKLAPRELEGGSHP